MRVSPTQYQTILHALNQDKHHIVYDKEERVFKDITSSKEAQNLSKERYATDLVELKGYISEFVKTCDPIQAEVIWKAVNRRADKLAGRLVLIPGSKRKEAVQGLRAIADEVIKVILAASKAAQGAIPTNVPPSSEGPQQRPGPQPKAAPRKPGDISAEKSPAGSSSTSRAESRAGSPTGAPPPPPPPMGAGKPKMTSTHRKLTKETPQFKGEPEHPQIQEGHDLGKPKDMPEEDRKKYAAAIDKYIFGTPSTVEVKKGLRMSTEIKRADDGLEHSLARIEAELRDHAAVVNQKDGLQVQLRDAEGEVKVLENRLQEMHEANEQNQPFTLYTSLQGGVPSKPITFIPDAEYKMLVQELSPEDLELLKESNAIPSTISNQITQYEGDLTTKKTEVEQLRKEYSTLEQLSTEQKARTDNGIPFTSWQGLLETKRDLLASWTSVLTNLKKSTKARDEKATDLSDKEIRLAKLLKSRPLCAAYQASFKSADPGTQAALAKSKPLRLYDADGK